MYFMEFTYFCSFKSCKMRNRITTIILLCIFMAISGCGKIEPEPITPPEPDKPQVNPPAEKPSWPEDKQGKAYIWDRASIPEICINISVSNWNFLLSSYDKKPDISSYVSCNVVFDNEESIDTVKLAGIRIRDNADGARPEGNKGSTHSPTEKSWNFCNFEIDFDRYKEGSTLRNVGGIFLKSCINDPSYARERYCYDLLERYGIWTISRNQYCRLSIHVEGDSSPAYIGVYQMIEPVDDSYILDREKRFEGSDGFIWRCSNGATLTNFGISASADKGNGENGIYLLMNNPESLSAASAQLTDFISKLNKLRGKEFQGWIISVCDVKLLLRTYAVIATVGMYDDYWNTGNNYYLYFNSKSQDDYEVFFIPQDFEKSLGNIDSDIMRDPGNADPYTWGNKNLPLISKLLQFEEFRDIYTEALRELILPEAYLFDYGYSLNTIKDFMYQVSFYTANDTGKLMSAKDRPSGWNSFDYNLTQDNDRNFFKVRSKAIKAAIGE